MLEPLGQSQVLRYLQRLSRDHHIFLLTFEKANEWMRSDKRQALRADIRDAGIEWIALRYHKRPTLLATGYDLLVGFAVCVYLVLHNRIQIVHARSYVSAVLALGLKQMFGTRFLFDMRGFWADEKVEGGTWKPGSKLYRLAKWFERHFLTNADVVVSLTHAGIAAMQDFPYLKNNLPHFEVIPTCTDLETFRPIIWGRQTAKENSQSFVLGCVGSVGLWYLFDRMLECFNILRQLRPNAKLLILNRGAHPYIWERLKAHAISGNIVEVKEVDYSEVVKEMARMDAGIFFIKPVFSKKGSAPTKLGEFLACGIPCLVNAGVGDYEKILEEGRVGVVLHGFDAQEQEKATRQLLGLADDPLVRDRCIAAARRHFSLDLGVERYDKIYRSLTRPS